MELLQLAVVVVACVTHVRASEFSYFMIEPQSPHLQIGRNFTATCVIRNTPEVTADDLRWRLRDYVIPKEHYRKINESAQSVTFTVTEETRDWLFCDTTKDSVPVALNRSKYQHAIILLKGYPPEKPQNLSCMATQDGSGISSKIHCEWKTNHRKPFDFKTTYTLNYLSPIGNKSASTQPTENSSDKVDVETFPNFMPVEFWVEAQNKLGKVESEHLSISEANFLVKTNPPSDVNIIPEDSFPTSLLLNWRRPVHETLVKLINEIRYAPSGAHSWINVPPADTRLDIQSFRLQNLRPFTEYVAQVRCKNTEEGYWSEWSQNTTQRTPPAKPTSKPDLWLVVTDDPAADERQVQLLSREPEFANGVITEYRVRTQECKDKLQDSQWETVPAVDADRGSKQVTLLKELHLSSKTCLVVKVIAVNSKGESPEASLVIPEKGKEPAPVQNLNFSSVGGKLFVEWSAPKNLGITEFVLQWTSGEYLDWQRENGSTRSAAIRGNLEEFVRYDVSVFPLYKGWLAKPTHQQTYLKQGAPEEGPSKITSQSGCKDALLMWEEIPLAKQRGFITNYTITYSTDGASQEVTVPSDRLSYRLTHLTRDTKYDISIKAFTVMGSTKGIPYSFTTLKYAPGEIEGIVVAVSLCFLFVVVLTMLICVCKRDVIKKSLWPEIPNPGESTIGSWSPDYPLKAETPSENCLSGISVLDVCDGKSVFEEDKSCLPLKKDKYLSEEHSSGIGGSSCMSSPRQSVSDSDEGGDMADTTASTVQYSSVVASSGYKGQTPSLQPQQAVFSRSESTQPLLECEENPDMLSLEGSRQSQRAPHLGHSEGHSPHQLEMEAKTLDFCSVEEDCEEVTSADDQPEGWLASAPISSYMPQLGGYRPQ